MFTKRKTSQIYQKIYPFFKGSFLYGPVKKLMANSAKFSSDNPSKDMFVIGVTGTNGKTTTSNILSHILNITTTKTLLISSAGIKVGNTIVKGYEKKYKLNTYDINGLLAMGRNMGCKVAVLEVSSVDLNKFVYEGIQFDAAILTNCTYDHVNYHKNFHDYTNSKKKLFKYVLRNDKQNKFAVFPRDDKTGRQWLDELPFDKKISFGINSSAVLKANKIKQTLGGLQFSFSYLGKEYDIDTKLLGAYNAYNILAALGVCVEMGVSLEQAIGAISSFQPLKSRMEKISQNGLDVFMDISYSPDALDKSLSFLANIKQQKKGRLIIVFGSPGNKDEMHRSQMGKILERFGTILIATDSEPDTENRLKILNDLTKKISAKEGEKLFIIPEREFAIRFAIEIADTNDIILLACRSRGKHQHTNLGSRDWDDEEIVLRELNKKFL